jgi:hypothetical protein
MTPASVSLAAPAMGAKAVGTGVALVKLVLISLNKERTGPKAAAVTGVLLTMGVMAAVIASMAELTAVTWVKQSGLHVWSGVVVLLQPAGQSTGASGASPAPLQVYSEVTLKPQLAGRELPQTLVLPLHTHVGVGVGVADSLVVVGASVGAAVVVSGAVVVGPAEVGPAEVGSAEVGPAEVGPAEVGPALVGGTTEVVATGKQISSPVLTTMQYPLWHFSPGTGAVPSPLGQL